MAYLSGDLGISCHVKGLDFDLLKKVNKKIALEEKERMKELEAANRAEEFETGSNAGVKNPLVSLIFEVIKNFKESNNAKPPIMRAPGTMIYSYNIDIPIIKDRSEARAQCLPTVLMYSSWRARQSKAQSRESQLVVNKVILTIRRARRYSMMSGHSLKKRKRDELSSVLKKQEPKRVQQDSSDTQNIVILDPEDDIFPSV